MKEIKWEQWSPSGLVRCGFKDLKTLKTWLTEIGKDAKRCVRTHEKAHAVYGRMIYDEQDNPVEMRFYMDTYMTDEELGKTVMDNPRDVFYVAHKDGMY